MDANMNDINDIVASIKNAYCEAREDISSVFYPDFFVSKQILPYYYRYEVELVSRVREFCDTDDLVRIVDTVAPTLGMYLQILHKGKKQEAV